MHPTLRRSTRITRAPKRHDPNDPIYHTKKENTISTPHEYDGLKILAQLASELLSKDPIDKILNFYSDNNILVEKTGPNSLKFIDLDEEEEDLSNSEYEYISENDYDYDSDHINYHFDVVQKNQFNQLREFQTQLLSVGDDQDKWIKIVEKNIAFWKK